jgi:predicted PhzF superfamily epimerase YddE/YHI9
MTPVLFPRWRLFARVLKHAGRALVIEQGTAIGRMSLIEVQVGSDTVEIAGGGVVAAS